MTKVDFEVWEKQDPERFLQDERDSEARTWAAKTILSLAKQVQRRRRGAKARRDPVPIIEMGCGPGIDYAEHFRKMREVSYLGIDGCRRFIESLQERFPEGRFLLGTFADLAAESADILYAKAVFEHQPQLEEPLSSFLGAARRWAIVNWYLPPNEVELINYAPRGKFHYNTWGIERVMGIVDASGFEEDYKVERIGRGNTVSVYRRK